MTKTSEPNSGRNVIVRWRILAARRLEHLIELYQTGRWKLYYKEPEFLRLVQEARSALQTWEALAPPDAVLDKVVEVEIAQSDDNDLNISVVSANDVSSKGNLRKS